MENVINILNDIIMNDYNIDKEIKMSIKKWKRNCKSDYEIFHKVETDSIEYQRDNELPLKSYEYFKAIHILYKYLELSRYTKRSTTNLDEGVILCDISINSILFNKLSELILLHIKRVASNMVGGGMILSNNIVDKEFLYRILEPNFAFF